MTVRDYDFITGPETSTLPTIGTPTNDADTLNKGWLEELGFNRAAVHSPVVNITALKAVTISTSQDNQSIYVDSATAWYHYDKDSTDTPDDDLVVQPNVGSGRWKKGASGTGSGGGSTYKFLAGEKIDGSTKAKAITLSKENVLSLTAASSYIDLNEGGGELNIQILSTDGFYRISDLYIADNISSEATYDLCEVIQTALNDDSNTTLTYDCSYNRATRVITLSASGAFTLLLSTGTNAANGLLKTIGFDNSSDTGSATSHTADNPIEDATSYTTKLLGYKSDADMLVSSKNYSGFYNSSTNKLAEASVVINTTVGDFTSQEEGDKMFTGSAAIIIETGVNDALDWKEGAGIEINSTLTAGTYYKGSNTSSERYESLRAEIKNQLDTDGSNGPYTVTWDNINCKFTISNDGSNAFTLLWGTGTNTSTNAAETLGWADSDTSSSATQTATSAIDLAGEVYEDNNTRATPNSVYTGFIDKDKNLFCKQLSSLTTTYTDVMNAPGDWIAIPNPKKDMGVDAIYMDHHVNAAGYGLAVFLKTGTSGDYVVYYKKPGTNWTQTTTTLNAWISGSTTISEPTSSYGTPIAARCIVDDTNNQGAIILARFATPYWYAYSAYSTDLDTWTLGNYLATGSVHFTVSSMRTRNDRAICTLYRSDSGNSYICHSTNSGSGFSSWNTVATSIGAISGENMLCEIQYFSLESSPNNYRYMMYFRESPSATRLVYCKGDGTGAASATIDGGSASGDYYPLASARDKAGDANYCIFFAKPVGGTAIKFYVTNDDYNSGTLVGGNVSSDINTNSWTSSDYNGYTSASSVNLQFNNGYRAVLVGGQCTFIHYMASRAGSTQAITVFENDSFPSNNFDSGTDRGETTGTSPQDQCMSIDYIPAINSYVMVWQKIDGSLGSECQSEGQIWGRIASINPDNSLSWKDAIQIDGGEAISGYQGECKVVASADGAWAVWEHYGSTYDLGWFNLLK